MVRIPWNLHLSAVQLTMHGLPCSSQLPPIRHHQLWLAHHPLDVPSRLLLRRQPWSIQGLGPLHPWEGILADSVVVQPDSMMHFGPLVDIVGVDEAGSWDLGIRCKGEERSLAVIERAD